MSVAIITGASSGIGAAVARELHRRGWKVGLVARRHERLTALADEMGEGAAWATADVTDADALAAAVGQLEQSLGSCDLMLANAGMSDPIAMNRFDLERVRRVFRVNVEGVLNTVAAVLPGMIERGHGHVAVVSSIAGFRGLPSFGPYSSSKAAVSTFFESMRVDLATSGIAVTTIHPGFVESEMTAKNNFYMPFMVPVDKAARTIAKGLERRAREINFPWPMIMLIRLVRALPNWIYDPLLRRTMPGGGKR